MTDEERYARNRNRALLVLAALLIGLALWSGCALGALQGGRVSLPESERWTVRVQVRAAATGTPIAGAFCRSEGDDGRTDAAGLVTLGRVPAGIRVVACSAPGYRAASSAPFTNDRAHQAVVVDVVLERQP